MKVQKTPRKAGPSKSSKAPEPSVINSAEQVGLDGVSIKLLTDTITTLKNENNEMRSQFKQLVEMLDKKFESMGQVKGQEALAKVRTDSVQPEQQDPRSEGLLNKKIGDTSFGEALSSIASIAKAWQQQTSMDRDSQGVNSLKDFMAEIGQSVFSDFVKTKGLKVAQSTAEETTASAYG